MFHRTIPTGVSQLTGQAPSLPTYWLRLAERVPTGKVAKASAEHLQGHRSLPDGHVRFNPTPRVVAFGRNESALLTDFLCGGASNYHPQRAPALIYWSITAVLGNPSGTLI